MARKSDKLPWVSRHQDMLNAIDQYLDIKPDKEVVMVERKLCIDKHGELIHPFSKELGTVYVQTVRHGKKVVQFI